ncbi:extracellular solute-binding protein [Acrocarpospora pleiomorpha]|nr:extracellular solute-binding protein [Acrocarpospora pleiomorpha]
MDRGIRRAGIHQRNPPERRGAGAIPRQGAAHRAVRQYAVPFATDAPLLFRRSGMPLPENPDALLEAAKRHGYAVQLDDYEGGSVTLFEALFSAGVRVTAGGEVVLDQPVNAQRAKQALAGWQAMMRSGAQRAVGSHLREEGSIRIFRSAAVGYMRNWAFAFHRLAMDSSMRGPGGELLFEVSPLPGTGVLGGSNLAVAANSANPEEAREFIAFLTDDEIQKKLFACSGYTPVLKSVYASYARQPQTCQALLSGTSEPPPTDGLETTAAELQALAGAMHAALEAAEPRPAGAHYSLFSGAFRSCARALVLSRVARLVDFDRWARALREAMSGRHVGERDACPADQ